MTFQWACEIRITINDTYVTVSGWLASGSGTVGGYKIVLIIDGIDLLLVCF